MANRKAIFGRRFSKSYSMYMNCTTQQEAFFTHSCSIGLLCFLCMHVSNFNPRNRS